MAYWPIVRQNDAFCRTYDQTDQTKKIIILKLKINLVLNVSLTTYLFCPTEKVPWGPFLESPGNFSGPKTCFLFVVFLFKVQISIILKIIE